jgi:hypothetical protein
MVNMVTRAVATLALLGTAITPVAATLVDFQVYPPVLTPYSPLGNELVLSNGAAVSAVGVASDAKACVVNQTLMVHTFGQSYGQPFVGKPRRPRRSPYHKACPANEFQARIHHQSASSTGSLST